MKEKVLDVALDIECASLRGDAAILSIAAVPFYPKKYPNPFSENVFYEVIKALWLFAIPWKGKYIYEKEKNANREKI